jgi:hypothetical protein
MTPEEHAALVDGVPPWMREDMMTWLRLALLTPAAGGAQQSDVHLVMDFDRRARSKDPLAPYLRSGFRQLEQELYVDDELYIRFLDFVVWNKSQSLAANEELLNALNSVLKAGGSRWKVGTRSGSAGLEERVPRGVQEAADAAIAHPGHAGDLLSEAWHAAFGVAPDFEKAYAKSIKAVEAAAIPLVSPKNTMATLGTVLTDIKNQKDWKLEMSREHPGALTKDVLLGMMQALWTGQNDRHAGQSGYTPSTQAEAEAAVMLAVPLVQWFSSGAIARRP